MNQNLEIYNNNINIIEVQLDKAIQNFLERRDYQYYDVKEVEIETCENIELVKIFHISYDREKSDTDLNLIDFQQLLSALASKSKKFVYVIDSNTKGIDLYLGTKNSGDFLKDTFEGIYPGSFTEYVCDRKSIFSQQMKYSKAMLGIPALKRDSEKVYKQSLEKILYPLQGKRFRILIVAESYTLETIQEIISQYQYLGNEIHKLVKQSKNMQKSHAGAEGVAFTKGESFSKINGTNDTESSSYGSNEKTMGSKSGSTISTVLGAAIGGFVAGPAGIAIGAGMGGMIGGNFFAKTKNQNNSTSKAYNSSRTNSTNQSESVNRSITKTDTIGITFEEIDKSAEYCEELVDAYIERFQKGLNHGMWNTALYIQTEEHSVLSELEHTLKSVYSGDKSYYETIRFSHNLSENETIDLNKMPMLYFNEQIKHPVHPSFVGFSSAINTEELSILAALPNNDVEGLSVSRISSFGLTQEQISPDMKSINIGRVLNRKKVTQQNFSLSNSALNAHLFVSGITGSGKSNTIKSILIKLWKEQSIPFLVLEPAKSEYQFLQEAIPKLQIFKPGAADDIFRLNPFVFDYRKKSQYNVLNHIDAIKSSFSAAFPMYGPMPYILEEAIQKVYEDKGWNLLTLEHPAFDESSGLENEFNRMLFPVMSDLLKSIEYIVDEAGYHDELQNNIKAALVTRIRNLTIGTKGFIFNSQHAILNEHLFEKPTIVELSSIVNNEEKSFLMGLLLNALYRYRESHGNVEELKHLVIVEEAHRLLPNISFEQSMESANAKASAVEMFTNMLAEIRSFGEGIIIADQVVNKLHSDVIKNTNVKILHRTMAKDDRTVIGESINLDENQILDIAELRTGEAIVHSKDVHQAFLVKIDAILERADTFTPSAKQFQQSFLEQYDYYKYELPFENKYYKKDGKNIVNKNIGLTQDTDIQFLLLEVITQVLLNEKNKVLEYWKKFINKIEEQIRDKDTNLYFAMTIFSMFDPISSISIYKKPYYFKKMYESVIDLFLLLQKNTDIEASMICFQKSVQHKKLKNNFEAMKYYPSESIDFSLTIDLLLMHNSVIKKQIEEKIPPVLKNREVLSILLDDIVQKLYENNSFELKYTVLAKYFKDEKQDLNLYIEEEKV